jgi:hypothetical protein
LSASISVRYSRKDTGTWASRNDVKNCKNMRYRLPAEPAASRADKPRPAGFFNYY